MASTNIRKICLRNRFFKRMYFRVNDCPIVDSETGERSVCFSMADLDESRGYCLKYMSEVIGTGDRICYGCSTPFRFVSKDNVNQLENKCSDNEENSSNIRSQQEQVNRHGVDHHPYETTERNRVVFSEMFTLYGNNATIEVRFICHNFTPNSTDTIEICRISKKGSDSEKLISSQQELMSKTTEVKDLSKRCAELEEQVKGYLGAENRRLLDELSSSKERVEELECLIKKTAEQQVLIDELNSSRSQLEDGRQSFDSENKLLKNELEDMEGQFDSLYERTHLIIKNSFRMNALNEELKEFRNGLRVSNLKTLKRWEEWKDREQAMANHWHEKECLFEIKMSHMRSRLELASDENQKLLEQNTRIETKIDEMMNKHNYFETKSQTNGATTDCDELQDEVDSDFMNESLD